MNKQTIKMILGKLPLTVDLYWQLVQRHKPWKAHYNLDFTNSVLADAVQQAESFAALASPDQQKNIFVFATLHYWIEYSALLSAALAGMGHDVTLSFLPYASWTKPIDDFDLRRQNLYTRQVLKPASSLLKIQPLLDIRPLSHTLPKPLMEVVDEVSTFDTQYTLQVEDITKNEDIYKLRYTRNLLAAQNTRAWLVAHTPDGVIVPNGTIQEMGVVYRVAKYLNIPTVTFEFSDQREHIWLAQNSEIMRHDTDDLWAAKGQTPLDESQLERLTDLFSAREDARTWKNFARKWQDTPSEGGAAVREKLGLDDRPVILLATNVLGDSLTLDRQTFSKTMAEWIERTILFFADRDDMQLIIRVHPGEVLVHGTSMVDVVNNTLSEIPTHIHMVEPEEKLNTYDILEITDLGLVYTTTVGLEMAMRGIPVIVAGKTHYRGRGFTYDPPDWEAYFDQLRAMLGGLTAYRLTREQIDLAWRYAYLFFFEFAKPFPWHLLDLKADYKSRPISYVLGEEGQKRYGATFDYMAGKPLEW